MSTGARGGRTRELAAVGLWGLAAVAWVGAMHVPWFRAGLPRSTAPMDVVELLRAGVLGVPPWTGFLVLLLPGASLVLLGLAPLRGRVVTAVRLVLWIPATAAGLVLVAVLGQLAGRAVGWGAVLVVLACALGGAALGCATSWTPGARSVREAQAKGSGSAPGSFANSSRA